MDQQLNGKDVAILVADETDAGVVGDIADALRQAGAEVTVTGPGGKPATGSSSSGSGKPLAIDVPLDETDADRFDAVIVVGEEGDAESFRDNHKAVDLVRRTIENGRSIALIGHSVLLLSATGLVGGMAITGPSTVESDLRNAGVEWANGPVVVENGIVTMRSSDYLADALPRVIEEFSEGPHERPGITDVVNEASDESFPASDPPGWQPATTAPEEEDKE